MSTDILLIESDPQARERYAAALATLGYQLRTATSGADARELLAELSPPGGPPAGGRRPLLITNLLLDDGPAFALASAWREAGRPVLVLSDAYRGATALQILGERMQTEVVVEAPVADDELLAQVRRLLPPQADTDPGLSPLGPEAAGDAAETPIISLRPARLDPAAVPLSGSLASAEVAAILARLALRQASGALMLQGQKLKKLVYLEGGRPVGIKSNLLAECLGPVLTRQGHLSPEVAEESFERARRSERRQGQVLLEMGAITAEVLADALQRQFWLKFRQIFTWTQGTFAFKEATVPSAYQGDLGLDAANLIWRGLDQARPSERVRAVLEPVYPRVVIWDAGGLDLSTLRVRADVHPLFDGIDGRRTAAEAIAHAPDPLGAELLLYALTAFGAVTYVT